MINLISLVLIALGLTALARLQHRAGGRSAVRVRVQSRSSAPVRVRVRVRRG